MLYDTATKNPGERTTVILESGWPLCLWTRKALSRCHVDRQGYHGGACVGNHVQKCLQVGNTLFQAITSKTYSLYKQPYTSIAGEH